MRAQIHAGLILLKSSYAVHGYDVAFPKSYFNLNDLSCLLLVPIDVLDYGSSQDGLTITTIVTEVLADLS